MCSIFGAFSQVPISDYERAMLGQIAERAKDRGRDGGRMLDYKLAGGRFAILGNWRATPTTEPPGAPPQPFDGVVHNGVIANDKELGNAPGAVDSLILPKVLVRDQGLVAFAESLDQIKGSYAIAAIGTDTVYLATNFKPIYVCRIGQVFYFSSMERHLAPLLAAWERPARINPYTAVDLARMGQGGVAVIPRQYDHRALVIASGGLDSTVAAWALKAKGMTVDLIHFTYGCNAQKRELDRVVRIGWAGEMRGHIVPIDYSRMLGASGIMQPGQIAPGIAGAEFAHEWVPARNLMMISHAVAFAEANNYGFVALGNNLEEAGAYPDNEEEFTNLLDQALDYAVGPHRQVKLLAPVGNLMKHEIVKLGLQLGVPFEHTWSCYRDGDAHCGECGPCFMRREAFRRNGAVDPVFPPSPVY